ncbi:MAG TPA: tetratricopeptide repeat protein [Candidatus Obscuribacter sp.]|nr:tetratricopeptide repeat protein [Candidatus Obscuribacter sp.]MBK9279697.1 tetratricopeptide repeat protein [Candidatus Obscuribacter sp.]MBL8081749.1 tetratricopeptide repeat protein [Candidatus Obscuribacter sp.]HMY53534.1 tetratricopeptide repeat protein [Candidatus Obscuribacter sp.]HNB14540.1 tetratricopeptide repeat protein [Candidatus Obscuribacter sp.]
MQKGSFAVQDPERKKVKGRQGKTTFCLLLAPLCSLTLSFSLPSSVPAQGQYYLINGKPASKETVDAYKLLQESVPLLQANRNEEAVNKLTEAARLAPDVAEVHNNLGLGLAKLGRTEEAQAELEQAVSLKPDLAVALMSLGGLYQSQGKVQKSLDTYTAFVNRFPTHPDAPKVKAIVAGMRKEIAEGTLAVESVGAPADNYLKELRGQLLSWPASRMPIKVYVAPGTGVNGFKPSFDRVLRNSFNEWSEASQGLVTFQFVDKPAEANLTCTWLGDAGSLRNRAEAGETNISADSKGICQGSIKLLTVPLMPALPVTENFLKQTCLHEIGHALGFGGHTNNPADVMFFTVRFIDKEPQLGLRDSRSIQMLYQGQAGTTR